MRQGFQLPRRTKMATRLGVAFLVGASILGAVTLTGQGPDLFTQVLGASTKKGDTTPPTVSVSAPLSAVTYGPATWSGCSPAGICGIASDESGVAQVDVSLRQVGGNYWNGSGFTSPTEVWLTAKGTTSWNLALALPAEGSYVVSARATDKAAVANQHIVSVGFAVYRTPPAVPVITAHPDDPTLETSATFSFTGAGTLQCALDGASFSGCSSPKSYSDLVSGTHTFAVRAVDSIGNASTPASFSWAVAIGNFGISGSLSSTAYRLYPGMRPAPLELTFTNPYSFPLNIKGSDIHIDVQQNAACPAVVPGTGLQNLVITGGTWDTVTVPARSSGSSLSALGVTDSAQWPHVTMQNLSVNQDTCKGATIRFTYTGTATK